MGTAISCTKCSQVAGLIQKLVETPRSSKAPSVHAAVLRAAVFVRRSCVTIVIVDRHLYGLSIYRCMNACMHTCAYGGAGGTGSTNG